jgi:Methylase involved in ubiquinone/menaquinone biosynthesis
MEKSSNATELVRDHFREQASSFDALYDEEHLLQRAVRPGLLKRRDFALEVVREYDQPRVLDIGGGSGRVGELILEAGASEWVNADIAQEMLDLSAKRLERFGDKVKLVQGDFLSAHSRASSTSRSRSASSTTSPTRTSSCAAWRS